MSTVKNSDAFAETAFAKPAEKPAKSAAAKATPEQHAKAKGLVTARRQTVAVVMKSPVGAAFPRPGIVHDYAWQHRCAARLHGWDEHAHHAGKPIELTESDYDAALQAASEPKSGSYVPHPAALSQFKGLGL